MKLPANAFDKAKSYLFSNCRSLERSIFRCFFEGGSKEAVISELEKFQNSDGGFGHAIEPDLRTPDSSAIATYQAFKTLKLIEADANHPIVKKAVDYLIESFDGSNNIWKIIPESAKDSPHAFWWAYDDIKERFGNFEINPTIALAGQLQNFSEIVPDKFLQNLLEISRQRLSSLRVDEGFYDLLCYVDLASAKNLSTPDSVRLEAKLKSMIRSAIAKDPSKWSEHALAPLTVISSKNSPFVDAIEPSLIDKNLDFEIESQQNDGFWAVPWSWEAAYPDAWKQTEKDWKGHFIVQKLLTLKSFGRL